MSMLERDGRNGAQTDVGNVVAELRRTFATGRTRDAHWRMRQLEGIRRLVTEHRAEVEEALAADLGRSAIEAYLTEVAPTVTEADHARRHVRRWMRPRRTGLPLSMLPGAGGYRYEPLGVVLVMAPWNYPVTLALGPLVAAVAAGNTVVLKPSELAPASSALLARLVPQYLDPEAVAVVEGDAATAQQLIGQAVDHVLFTGGPATGRLVMEAAARHLTPVTLELGGKSPVIVAADADLAVAARRIALAKLLNAGQTCIAPDHVLVEAAVRDELVDRLCTTFRAFAGDRPVQRLANARQFDRVARLLADHGGQVVLGGAVDRPELRVEPTLVVDPDPATALMTEEIFGPVLPIVTVASVGEAIAFVGDRPKPLALYLFTRSRETAARVVDETSSGAVCVNQVASHFLAPQLPFGGVGTSGTGAYHGEWGFRRLSHCKAVLRTPSRPDPSLQYPPYTPAKERLLRRFS